MQQTQLMLIPINRETVRQKENWVTKGNALVEANYRLTAIQQKIVITMASLVQPADEEFKWYKLTIKDFAEILGRNDHAIYAEMVASVKALMKVVIMIPGGRPRGGDLYTHWIQSAGVYKLGDGFIEVTIDSALKPFFLHLKERFTTYRLKNVMQLKSAYSIRIYELLKQYQPIGKRTIALQRLREMLGIEPKEYRLYGHFKNKVISVAQREINEKTDITFHFKEIKTGRKVAELEFVIEKKPFPPKVSKGKKKADLSALSNEDLCRVYAENAGSPGRTGES